MSKRLNPAGNYVPDRELAKTYRNYDRARGGKRARLLATLRAQTNARSDGEAVGRARKAYERNAKVKQHENGRSHEPLPRGYGKPATGVVRVTTNNVGRGKRQ